MNWRRIGISLAIYVLGASFGCAIVLMLPSAKRPGDFVLPFMPGAVNELRGRRGRGQFSCVGTQLVGIIGILLFSLSAHAGLFWPERVIAPLNSFLGALVSVYLVRWTLDRVMSRITPESKLSNIGFPCLKAFEFWLYLNLHTCRLVDDMLLSSVHCWVSPRQETLLTSQ